MRKQKNRNYIFLDIGDAKWYSSIGKEFGSFVKSWTILPNNPAIALLDITQLIWKPMFTQNLLVNVYSSFIQYSENWEQSRCPSFGWWINKLCYFHTVNELSCQEETWRELKHILLGERSQYGKVTNHHVFFLTYVTAINVIR